MANPEHLAKLKEGVEDWNKWREENPDIKPDLSEAILKRDTLSGINLSEVNLSGAELWSVNLSEAYLSQVNLTDAKCWKVNLSGANLEEANLTGACFQEKANLCGAILTNANLSGADLRCANLSKADLMEANLTGAKLKRANLTGADLREANLTGADLIWANLTDADLFKANLSGVMLGDAKLHGTKIVDASLQGAYFRRVEVDGSTRIWGCRIDRCQGEGIKYTDFDGVGLGDIRIDSPTRQLLEYNIRRANWNRWFQGNEPWFMPPLEGLQKRWRLAWTWPVRWFWALSDYGASTRRIIFWFFLLSLVFAAVYANLAYWAPPGAVHDMAVEKQGSLLHYGVLVIVRPIYFSVVTMTTLGFGDMHAEKGSILGHILLTLQVLLGYVMLGALVTRFAVMFTGGGPAGKFAPIEEPPEPTEKPPHLYPLSQIMGYFWL